jgi:hypothetical protein
LTARNGLWLTLFLAPVAATQFPKPSVALLSAHGSRALRGCALAGTAFLGGIAVLLVVLGRDTEAIAPVSHRVVSEVAKVAKGEAVLSTEPAVESFAQAGIRVWISDPIDAFSMADQRAYLDFLQGLPEGQRAVDSVGVMAVPRGSGPDRLIAMDPQLKLVGEVEDWLIYRRFH